MSWYFLAAFVAATLGVSPLVIARRPATAAIWGTISFVLLSFFYWLGTPSTAYPFAGFIGVSVLVLWLICCVVDNASTFGEYNARLKMRTIYFFVGGITLYFGSCVYTQPIFHANSYATMIGTVRESEWTNDVQPKDPRHMIMVSKETAVFMARKAVSQGGAIGSQFQLDYENARLQQVKGELVYIFPLDFQGFAVWQSSGGIPAYVIVYAEDPNRSPRLIELSAGHEMHYTPGAYFGTNLERYLRFNGFMSQVFENPHLELDDEDNLHWVISTSFPTIGWSGEKVSGVVTVNPNSGKIDRYSVGEIPAWIDRVFPANLVESYLAWHGAYSEGWWNSFWTKRGITEPEVAMLIYGQGDRAEYVAGMTSNNEKDDSLVGLMYVDSRSGEATYYNVKGGATDTAVLNAVNANVQVQYKHLRGTVVQIYNVYGHMAAVVPLVNETSAFQGVAIVQVQNVQVVGVGATQLEALRNYQAISSQHGQQVALEKTEDEKVLEGVVDRIRQDIGPNGSLYLFHLQGVARIFVGSQEYTKLPLTQAGDHIKIHFIASGEDVVPVIAFDNLDLPLESTQAQKEVREVVAAHDTETARVEAVSNLSRQLESMSPEDLRKLEEVIRQKP